MKIISKIKGHYSVFLILAIILLQNPVWPFWYIPYTELSFVVILLLFFQKSRKFRNIRGNQWLGVFSLVAAFCFIPLLRGGFHGSNFIYIMCFMAALCINTDESSETLEVLSKILGVIVGVSVVAWLIHMTVRPLPVVGTIDLTAMKGSPTLMENYIFFVQNTSARSFRFYSIFDEPGVLGTLGAYILFVNSYNFKKWYNIALLIGCLCTMSMAFYVLTIIGMVYKNTTSLKTIFLTAIGLLIAYLLLHDILIESDDFNSLIVERMTDISGRIDHRTSDMVNSFYDNMSMSEFLFGIGIDAVVSKGLNTGASYKLFIIENGLLSLLALIFAYFQINKKNTMPVLVFVGLFWISFLQRPTAFNGWQMLTYSCIVTYLGQFERKKPIVKPQYKTAKQ